MCTWTDCADGAEADFTEWYNRQHLAERVGVPGFLSGARYVAERGAPKYLAYYEWESTAVGPSPAYMERQDNPTRWTRRIMSSFQNTIRTVFRRRLRLGLGRGAAAASLRFAPEPGQEARLERRLERILPRLQRHPGMVGVTLLQVDADGSRMNSNESRMRAAPDALAAWAIHAEAMDMASLKRAWTAEVAQADLAKHGAARRMQLGYYRLLFALSKDGADEIRPAPDAAPPRRASSPAKASRKPAPRSAARARG
jgi:heme-degrading monooxygenase HmoA